MQSEAGFSQSCGQADFLDTKLELAEVGLENAKSEVHFSKEPLRACMLPCKKLQTEGPRNRHNSSHKHHQTEFDLNSLPMEEFRSVIAQELHLKEKGVRQCVQIDGSHQESEFGLSKDEHSCGGSTVDDESRVLEDTLGKLSLTPTKSNRTTSSQESRADSEEEIRLFTASAQSSVTGESQERSHTQDSSALAKTTLSTAGVQTASQYRVVQAAVGGTPQQYIPYTQSLPAKEARDRFTSRTCLTLVTVFDWDDTLLCTSFLEEVKGSSLQRATVYGRQLAELDKYTVGPS